MRKAPAVAFLGVATIAVIALAAVSLTDQRRLAFAFGVVPQAVAVQLGPDQEACQEPVAVAESFSSVRFQVGTFGQPGIPLAVSVRRAGRTLAGGRLAGGYPDVSQQTVRLDDEVEEGRRVSVCFRNSGAQPLALYGGPEGARLRSDILKEGRPVGSDLTLDFLRERRSALVAVPDIFRRATVFAAGWVGAWTLWLAAVVVLLLVPLLLARALWSAAVSGPQDEGDASR